MKTALVLVDIQNDYFPGGNLELVNPEQAGGNARRLLDYFREKSLPVFHVQNFTIREGATAFLKGTRGAEIHESVAPLPGETIIQKNHANSFRETDLEKHLKEQGIERLIITGMMSHMCVDAITRAAYDKGYQCIVAHDACTTKNLMFNGTEIPAPHVHGAFMAALGWVYAKIMSTDEVLSILE